MVDEPLRQGLYRFEVTDEEASAGATRLDVFVADKLRVPRSQVRKWNDAGHITVNGETTKAGYRVREGDHVDVFVPALRSLTAKPQPIPLDIVYEDNDLIVINKGSDLVVHPAPGHEDDTVVNALLHHCRDLSGIGGTLRPGIVHRLDKDTTGLMVAAKNDRTHQALSQAIQAREVKRHYLAFVHGILKESPLVIDRPLGRHPRDRKKMAVVPGGRSAVTHCFVRKRLAQFTLVECQLETGRTHQIRVHLAACHHPVVGDSVYGPNRQAFGCKRQLLHAHYLAFEHPTKGFMEFRAKLPQDFREILRKAWQITKQEGGE